MGVVLLALLATVGFSLASLVSLFGGELGPTGRTYTAAFAAGILLALAFADLFPEGLELAEAAAISGFVGGFALLFLTEAVTRFHTHHLFEEPLPKRALGPFDFGLAVHNLADGFVLGVSTETSGVVSGLVGLGILVHQVPVGISLAAVLVTARATRGRVVRTTVLLGLAIPLAATLTLAVPVSGEQVLGLLTGVAAGVLAYLGATHLLPESQAGHPSRVAGFLFVATLVAITAGLLVFEGG